MDDVDDFLEHYGVKGMKWGVTRAASGVSKATSTAGAGVRDAVRRAKQKRADNRAEVESNSNKARANGYSARMRSTDRQDVGERGTRRIEKRVADGERIVAARLKERARSMATGLAVGTAILATPIAIGATSQGLSKLASNINAKRGAEAARKLFADSKGLTSYSTVALAFNTAKGTWE